MRLSQTPREGGLLLAQSAPYGKSTAQAPEIETLVDLPLHNDCHLYSRKGAGNLTVRKVYGKDRIRYLRCRACSREFSERKNTALFNSKIEESKAISVAEHLSEGVSMKGTSRLVGVSPEVVRRLRRNLGDHSKEFHDERVRDIKRPHRYRWTSALWVRQEQEGALFLGSDLGDRSPKPASDRIRGGKEGRLTHRGVDGVHQAAAKGSEGSPRDHRRGESLRKPLPFGLRGALPPGAQRTKRTLPESQTPSQKEPRPPPTHIKRREGGGRVVEVVPRTAHGSRRRVEKELGKLGYDKPNLSAIERQNGTARRMNAYLDLVRRSLAFGRKEESREALGWWSAVVYNFCRTQRGLRVPLCVSEGRRRYERRTPAMAANLTDSIWTVADVLRTPVYPAGGAR